MAEFPTVPQTPPTAETPQLAAIRWVTAIMDHGNLSVAWPLTDPTLRLVLAQDWVWTHRHHPKIGHDRSWDELARGMATVPPARELWDAMADELIGRWQKSWKGLSIMTWATWEETEVVALDLEMVTFIERVGDQPVRFEPGRSAFARRFLMRHSTEGWRVAGVNGDQLFAPGWPPSLEV